MAQHAILNHPDLALADDDIRDTDRDWSPRTKLACLLACTAGSWALVLAPFFIFT